MRRESSILHQVRNDPNVVSFFALYESPRYSVIVTDFLVGGDLVERTASPDFVLNETKCKSYMRQVRRGRGSYKRRSDSVCVRHGRHGKSGQS